MLCTLLNILLLGDDDVDEERSKRVISPESSAAANQVALWLILMQLISSWFIVCLCSIGDDDVLEEILVERDLRRSRWRMELPAAAKRECGSVG